MDFSKMGTIVLFVILNARYALEHQQIVKNASHPISFKIINVYFHARLAILYLIWRLQINVFNVQAIVLSASVYQTPVPNVILQQINFY